MPKIILLNLRAEFPPDIGLNSVHPLVRACLRTAWYADTDDVIVSPVEFSSEMLGYVARTLGFDPATVRVICCGQVLTDEVLLSDQLLEQVRAASAHHSDWTLMPCFVTEGVAQLGQLLGFADTAGAFAAQRGCDLLNRKSLFRQLAVGAGVPLCDGSVVRSAAALTRAIGRHLPATGTVIVKRDNAGGGLGNIAVTRGQVCALPGTHQTRSADTDLVLLGAELWSRLTDEQNQVVVVEAYHSAQHLFYVEYLLQAGIAPQFLNSGTFKLRPVQDEQGVVTALTWVGLELPADVMPYTAARAISSAARFIARCEELGYRGYINLDLVVDLDGTMFFNEANARWGGGLVLHTVGTRLLGVDYADHHIVSSVRDVPPVSLSDLSELLEHTGLHYRQDSREGILVLASDPDQAELVECVIIAADRARVAEYDTMLRAAVDTLVE